MSTTNTEDAMRWGRPVSILPLATRVLKYRADLLVEARDAAAEHEHGSDEERAWWMLDYVLNAAAWKCALADEREDAARARHAADPATPLPPTTARGRGRDPPIGVRMSDQQQLTEDAYAEPGFVKPELPPDPPVNPEVIEETIREAETVVVDRSTGEMVVAGAQPLPRDAALDLLHPSRKEIEWIAQAFIASGYIKDAQGFGQAVTKIIAGLEIGVAPFQAMRGLHIIDGKPEFSAGLVGALVKRSGRYNYLPQTSNDEECILDWYENGDLVGQSSFSMAEAQRAKLVRAGSNWEKFPKAMLFNRALTAGARMYCPDVFGGAVYAEGEIEA